jgi:uncharacterized protein
MIAKMNVLAIASALAIVAAQPAFAQNATNDDEKRPATISVMGEGEAAIAPDMAIVTLTVVREAETAREALTASNQAMDEVLAAMRTAEIADRDLQTSNFAIQPQYVYPDGDSQPQQPRITGYEASNTLTVRLRDLEKLGALLDEAVTLGVNQGGNIIFTNDDPSTTLNEARRDAVGDARERAEILAEAAGVELGRILSIDEQTMMPQPIPMARMEARSFDAAAAVPVATGENAYRITVTMRFEIEEGTAE